MTGTADTTGSQPRTPEGRRAFRVSPFRKLADTHAINAMADAMVAAALAGSLFFNMPAGSARVPVLRYLVITMLPFAVLSPLIGPLIDRMKGGHRLVVIASLAARACAAWLLATTAGSESVKFFLYALFLLVCQKSYAVARSAMVPTIIRSATNLVKANSQLALISGIASFAGVVPAAILVKLPFAGPSWALYMAMVTYAVAVVMAVRIKPVRVAETAADEAERVELRRGSIVMAGSAMGLVRACVGFLTLVIAFDFHVGGRPAWQFGVVGLCSILGQLAGAASGPKVRERTSEENLLTGVLALIVIGGFASVMLGGWVGASLLGASVGFASGGGKLAFDSILQRDAPDANRGRAFARFETRFQVMWVIGALIPVALDLDASTGFVVVFVTSLAALGSYGLARMSYAHETGTHRTPATARAAEIEERMSQVSAEVKERITRKPREAIGRLRRTSDLDPEDGSQGESHGPGIDGPGFDGAEHAHDEVDDRLFDADSYDDDAFGADPQWWPRPQWSDGIGDDLAASSPVAWAPDDEAPPHRPVAGPDDPTVVGP